MLPAEDSEAVLTVTSSVELLFTLSGVDFLGDSWRDLVTGDFFRNGEIGAVGFKIDFTKGVATD